MFELFEEDTADYQQKEWEKEELRLRKMFLEKEARWLKLFNSWWLIKMDANTPADYVAFFNGLTGGPAYLVDDNGRFAYNGFNGVQSWSGDGSLFQWALWTLWKEHMELM